MSILYGFYGFWRRWGFRSGGVSRGGGAVQKACSLNDLLDSCLFMSCQSNQFHSAQLDSDLTWIASNCCCAAAKCKFLPNPKHMYVWTPVLKILANATFHFFSYSTGTKFFCCLDFTDPISNIKGFKNVHGVLMLVHNLF